MGGGDGVDGGRQESSAYAEDKADEGWQRAGKKRLHRRL